MSKYNGAEHDLWGQNAGGLLETVELDENRESIDQAIVTLPDREALVIRMYYQEDLNMREIGVRLGCSESRVCQLHAKALIRLKSRLGE